MPWSLHSHSGQFCKHASGTLEQCVEAAFKRGFSVFGLSEHMPRYRSQDLYPEEIELNMKPDDLAAQFAAYVAEGRRLQRLYKGRMDILVGCETEMCSPSSLAEVLQLRNEHGLEYIVGSVHHVNGVPIDFDEAGVARAEAACGGSTEALFVAYFQQVKEMIEALRPDVVGHVDLVRLFRPEQPLTPPIRAACTAALQAGVHHGCIFEINTSGLRKGLRGPYPHDDVLHELLALGAKLTISDDSHKPEQVAVCYPELRSRLLAAGVDTLHRLQHEGGASDAVVAVAVPRAEWEAHAAWSQ